VSTPLFTTPPTVMFVGSDPDVADACARAMPAVALLRVGNALGAVQRMLITRPLVVIVDGAVPLDLAHDIADCARDIRAGFVRAAGLSRAQVTEAVTTAALDAERRRANEPPPSAPPPSSGEP
jgi:hypothetical protein